MSKGSSKGRKERIQRIKKSDIISYTKICTKVILVRNKIENTKNSLLRRNSTLNRYCFADLV